MYTGDQLHQSPSDLIAVNSQYPSPVRRVVSMRNASEAQLSPTFLMCGMRRGSVLVAGHTVLPQRPLHPCRPPFAVRNYSLNSNSMLHQNVKSRNANPVSTTLAYRESVLSRAASVPITRSCFSSGVRRSYLMLAVAPA